ncbi:MFS transporter [Novosphingobium sp. M1R2S20]|uniref:MFS transporter n=1 Tax=Novosphingobium rhizovicinum TaxID=3228928 RepID=A0ABV3RBH0_9SPHN
MTDDRTTGAAQEWRDNWGLVLAGAGGMTLAALPLASIGVMMAPIEAEMGWGRASISTGPSAAALVSMCFAAFAGLAVDRFGPRRIGIAAAGSICAAVALLSQVSESHAVWWSLWIFVGIAGAAMPTVWLAPISRLFQAGRGLAVAVVLSGAGISSSLVPIVTNALVEQYGWRVAYLALAGIWGGLAIPLVVLLFNFKLAATTPADTPKAPPQSALPGLTARQGLASPTYYKVVIAVLASMLASSALAINLVPILDFRGFDGSTAAALAGLVGVMTLIGKVVGGYLTDRLGARVMASAALFLSCVLPVGLLFGSGDLRLFTVAVVIYGLMAGATLGAVICLVSGHFGARAFGVLCGGVNAAMALGISLGPLLANGIYDRTHSYEPIMWAAIPLMLLAGALFASLGSFPKFGTKAEPGDEPLVIPGTAAAGAP